MTSQLLKRIAVYVCAYCAHICSLIFICFFERTFSRIFLVVSTAFFGAIFFLFHFVRFHFGWLFSAIMWMCVIHTVYAFTRRAHVHTFAFTHDMATNLNVCLQLMSASLSLYRSQLQGFSISMCTFFSRLWHILRITIIVRAPLICSACGRHCSFNIIFACISWEFLCLHLNQFNKIICLSTTFSMRRKSLWFMPLPVNIIFQLDAFNFISFIIPWKINCRLPLAHCFWVTFFY